MVKVKSKSKGVKPPRAIEPKFTGPLQFDEPNIIFSFKHWDLSSKKFSVNGKKHDYFHKILCRLKDLCRYKPSEIIQRPCDKTLRFHPIDWSDTTEKEGFDFLNPEYSGIAFQFSISANAHGRVHGFLIKNVFYVVWFDPDHKLYS